MNIREAKAKLSELIRRAEAGEVATIACNGRPVVTLTPALLPERARRRLGFWDHLDIDLPENLFLEPDPDIEAWLKEWENEPIVPRE